MNNRRKTKGRKIYYQTIYDKKTGRRIKNIKHIQLSNDQLLAQKVALERI